MARPRSPAREDSPEKKGHCCHDVRHCPALRRRQGPRLRRRVSVDCIYEGERSLYINADECVDCGACEPVCPTEAIFYEDDVPEEWED